MSTLPLAVQRVYSEVHILLDWINDTLKPRQPCVSLAQLRSGVIWCRLMTKLFPALLDEQRIKVQPQGPKERSDNYKLLKSAFKAASITWCFNQQALTGIFHIVEDLDAVLMPERDVAAVRAAKAKSDVKTLFFSKHSFVITPNTSRTSFAKVKVPRFKQRRYLAYMRSRQSRMAMHQPQRHCHCAKHLPSFHVQPKREQPPSRAKCSPQPKPKPHKKH